MSRAADIIEFCETLLAVPDGAHAGQPLRLLDFQKAFIRAVYDAEQPTRRAFLSMARKGGKTTLTAALLLAHLVGPEAKLNAQIVSGAMSRDQAAIVFGLAAKMVQLSPVLSKLVRIIPSGKRLIGLPLNTEYRALAADGRTAHGTRPVPGAGDPGRVGPSAWAAFGLRGFAGDRPRRARRAAAAGHLDASGHRCRPVERVAGRCDAG